MEIDKENYPHLFQERVWPWRDTPWRAVFELGIEPPKELISNVTIVPHTGDGWLLLRWQYGWSYPGGKLEPGESYRETIRRELLEEAGARLESFTPFGAWHCFSFAKERYRPHLPWPDFYRVVGYGEVERVGEPNPGEQILEVASFCLEEACRCLGQRAVGGPMRVEMLRLAAVLRA